MKNKYLFFIYVLILALLLSFAPCAAAAPKINIQEVSENNLHFDASYVYVDITFDDIHDLQVYCGKGTIDELVKEANAGFAINCIYWNYEDLNKYIVFNGELIKEFETDSIHDYCIIYDDGTMSIIKADEVKSASQFPGHIWQAWSFGPALVHNGIAIDNFDDCFKSDLVDYSHPRSAIGYFGQNHFCFLTVAGRAPGNRGAYLDEMARFFTLIGCREAYNLDGGGSSHIWYNGREYGEPCEDRAIPEIIYINKTCLQN